MKIDNKNVNLNKLFINIFKVLLCLSAPFFTILLSNRFLGIHILIGAFCSFVVFIILNIKCIKLEKINIKKFILTLFLSMFVIKELLTFGKNNVNLLGKIFDVIFNLKFDANVIKSFLGILALPCMIFIIYLFIEKLFPIIKKFFKDLTKVEKYYLLIIGTIAVILSVVITYNTTAFSKTHYLNKLVWYDVIYTSDSGALSSEDTFFNVSYLENDIRQPLFGIFSLPFALVAKIFAHFCFFFPNGFEYEVGLTIIQFLLIAFSNLLLARLLKLKESDKKLFYLFMSVSFPYLIFSILLEQYVIGLFYLILAIYLYFQSSTKINYTYIAAVGTMLTSGVVFPLITKAKKITNWVKDVFKCFIAFVITFVVGGQFPQLLIGGARLSGLTGEFIGHVSWSDKLYQFTNFVKGIFVSEPGKIVFHNGYHSYQLLKFNSISIIGVLLLVVIIFSFIINRKNKMAQISFLWVLFSGLVLFIMGWGTIENGLVLYGLYFAWAYLILYYLLLKKVIKNQKIFNTVLIITIIIMLIFNIDELINIFDFALKYY